MRYNPKPQDKIHNIAFKDITDHLSLKQINYVRKLLSKYHKTEYHKTKIDWSAWDYSALNDCLYYQPFGEQNPVIIIKCHVCISVDIIEC